MSELITRIVKSDDCKICKKYLPRLKEQGFAYEIYDADDPKNQDELDEWKIEKMPVVQIVEVKGLKRILKYQFAPGPFSTRIINYKIQQLKKAKK